MPALARSPRRVLGGAPVTARAAVERCPGCASEIDPTTCHCGSEIGAHSICDNHSPVPNGCICHRVGHVGWAGSGQPSDEIEAYAEAHAELLTVVHDFQSWTRDLRVRVDLDGTVDRWATRTFGPLAPGRAGIESTWSRLQCEIDELGDAVRLAMLPGDGDDGIRAQLRLEIADVRILLARLAVALGTTTTDAALDKHEINRQRAWHPTGDGHGFHCRSRAGRGECHGCRDGLPLVEPEVDPGG